MYALIILEWLHRYIFSPLFLQNFFSHSGFGKRAELRAHGAEYLLFLFVPNYLIIFFLFLRVGSTLAAMVCAFLALGTYAQLYTRPSLSSVRESSHISLVLPLHPSFLPSPLLPPFLSFLPSFLPSFFLSS
jgi:hypothetical protein